jgi:hypothetical protein
MAEVNRANDRIFEYIVARSRARESSILAVVAIASSASLVLLGLYIQEQIEKPSLLANYQPWIEIMGTSFASLGIVYREITAHYIHRNDERWIRRVVQDSSMRHLRDDKGDIEDPLNYCKKNIPRELMIRSLFVLPIIGWAWAWTKTYLYLEIPYAEVLGIILTVLTVAYVLTMSLCEKKD